MGLSVEERQTGIFWAIRRVVEYARELPKDDQRYEKIKEYAEDLWPAFLGHLRDPTYWLSGSHTEQLENFTPWGVAITEIIDEYRQQQPVIKDKPFDPLMGSLSIEGLLDKPDKTVHSIYRWIEQLTYYLRRYADEFLRSYARLSDLCARIQGECFTLFVDNEAFACAYVGQQICKILLEKNDGIAKRVGNDLHHVINHNIRTGELMLDQLLEIRDKLTRSGNRLRALAALSKKSKR